MDNHEGLGEALRAMSDNRNAHLARLADLNAEQRAHQASAILTWLEETQHIVIAARNEAVLELRRQGCSFANIGKVLGVSYQRASQIWERAARNEQERPGEDDGTL